MGKVKIQSGIYLNRQVEFLDDANVRPSGARVRKIIFDWLRFDIRNKNCLDLFSGSGALALEAVSNGCKSVVCIDHNKQSCQKILSESNKLGVQNLRIICQSIPCALDTQFDVCFLDAPFDQDGLLPESLQWLSKGDVLCPGGMLYVESKHELTDVEGMIRLKHKKVSNVHMQVFQVRDE